MKVKSKKTISISNTSSIFPFLLFFFFFLAEDLKINASFRPAILQLCFIDKLKLILWWFLEPPLKTGFCYRKLLPHTHIRTNKGYPFPSKFTGRYKTSVRNKI